VDVPLSTSTVLATRDQLFSANEQLALAGILAGYSGLTRDAYTLDLRQYVAWCTEHQVAVFGARRADIECFARHLESLGRARATIARRLCTVACFYRYAEQEGLIAVSRRRTCGDPAWTTSPTPPASIATRSAPCWWPPGWPAVEITR
jgi:site-specific recombinase XerD